MLLSLPKELFWPRHAWGLEEITGYLGVLTTFSTFGLETVTAFRGGKYLVSAANILANNVIGSLLVFWV
jgi:fluoride ion exporter CrcB/FEX